MEAVAAPILVVEDHADTRDMVAALLSSEGYTVVTAENGRRGLDELETARPCLVLLDLSMPVMTGWEFRNAQLSLHDQQLASTPVLLLTAIPDPEAAARQLHVDGVIPKPLDYDRLLDIIRAHCGPPRSPEPSH